MIRVMAEPDNLSSDLSLQFPRREYLVDKKSLWEEPIGLLAEADDIRRGHTTLCTTP